MVQEEVRRCHLQLTYLNLFNYNKYYTKNLSILFNVPEGPGLQYGLLQSLPVLNVTRVVADATVEYIPECVLSQELVAEYPHHPRVLELDPELPQVGNGVDVSLPLRQQDV